MIYARGRKEEGKEAKRRKMRNNNKEKRYGVAFNTFLLQVVKEVDRAISAVQKEEVHL